MGEVELKQGEERITFYGGPREGEVVIWRGGDTVEFPIHETLAVRYDYGAKNVPIPVKTLLYRRSLRDRSIFVFQP